MWRVRKALIGLITICMVCVFVGCAASIPAATTNKKLEMKVSNEQWKAAFTDGAFQNVTVAYYEEKQEISEGVFEWVIFHMYYDHDWMRVYVSFQGETLDEVLANNANACDQVDFDIMSSAELAGYLSFLMDRYDQFAYDELTDSYNMLWNGATFEVAFENGKLSKVICSGTGTDDFQMYFTDYGITEVAQRLENN